ncbi:unnamed protein product [Lactuca saligna]|uniref:Uncharacterized protein n=1 Tax=Lactuca saligna TaxID=75948 RepID=A0AA35W1R3_LACSI|nr:unnamed protein product [Lactuca saligna]
MHPTCFVVQKVAASASIESIAVDEEKLDSDSGDEPVKLGLNYLHHTLDDDTSIQGKGRKRGGAPRGRGRGSTTAKRGRKSDNTSSSIQDMMMSKDDDDEDVPKKANKSQPRLLGLFNHLF